MIDQSLNIIEWSGNEGVFIWSVGMQNYIETEKKKAYLNGTISFLGYRNVIYHES